MLSRNQQFLQSCLDGVIKGVMSCHLYNHLLCSLYGYWEDEMTGNVGSFFIGREMVCSADLLHISPEEPLFHAIV